MQRHVPTMICLSLSFWVEESSSPGGSGAEVHAAGEGEGGYSSFSSLVGEISFPAEARVSFSALLSEGLGDGEEPRPFPGAAVRGGLIYLTLSWLFPYTYPATIPSASSSTTSRPALRAERTQEYLARTTSVIGSFSFSSSSSCSLLLHSADLSPFPDFEGLRVFVVDERDNHGTRVEVALPQVDTREGVDGPGGTVRVEERLGDVGGVLAFGVVGLEEVKAPKKDALR